jgi:hypothetical protein
MSASDVSLVSKPSPLLPMPWEASLASKLPENATSEQRGAYYDERRKANLDHEQTPAMLAHKRLRRRDDESDPEPGIEICHDYLLAKYEDPEWLTKLLTVLLFANKALSIPIWDQYYRDQSKLQKVRKSLAVCVKLAILALEEGGVVLEQYFAPKTIELFRRKAF